MFWCLGYLFPFLFYFLFGECVPPPLLHGVVFYKTFLYVAAVCKLCRVFVSELPFFFLYTYYYFFSTGTTFIPFYYHYYYNYDFILVFGGVFRCGLFFLVIKYRVIYGWMR